MTTILFSLYIHFLCLFFFLCFVGSPKFVFSSPLPEGGEVDGRVIVTDDSQESLPESEVAESKKSVGSSEKETRSDQHSESGHSISPPLAIYPDGHKRKRDDVEDSGASKLVAEESPLDEEGAFDPFADASAVSS
jgi:hypothetical protein